MKTSAGFWTLSKLICPLLILLLCAAEGLHIQKWFIKYAGSSNGRIEVSIKSEYKESNIINSKLLSYDDMLELKNKVKEDSLLFYSETDAYISNFNKTKNINVQLVLSDEDILDSMGAAIIKGSPIYERVSERGDKVAVISDDLANRLFMSLNAVGEKVYINNEEFRIIGVFGQQDSIYKNLVWNGKDKVLVPFRSYPDYKSKPIHTIILRDSQYENLIFRVDRFWETVNGIKEVDTSKYYAEDFYYSDSVINQLYKTVLLFPGVLVIAVLLLILIKYYKLRYLKLRTIMKKAYISEIMKRSKRRILFDLVIFILAILVLYFLLQNIVFIPNFPDEVITDIISFDFENMLADIYKIIYPYQRTPFISLYYFTIRINILIILLSLSSSLVLFLRLRKSYFLSNKNDKIMIN
ncbi:MAG: ABC transporter permease [Clostridium sp.]|nr:ABC transporter permease [Clostridium sp.]